MAEQLNKIQIKAEILTAISKCLSSENLDKLRERLIFIEWNNEYSDVPYNPYTQEDIHNQILAYNTRASQQDLQRILKHSLVTRNPTTEVEAMKVVRNVGNDLSKLEAERVIKNLDYIENVLTNVDVDIAKYEALVEKLPHHVSRKDVIERCIKEGSELPPTRRQVWLEKNLERGASYNKTYSYKELNQLSRDLERYKTHRLDYETSIMENRQADREGYGRVNDTKTWIWSQLEKTRHQGMDGETVPLTAKFEVVNEMTGDIDYLLFPGDVSNDTNNCSNICNCGCTFEVNKA